MTPVTGSAVAHGSALGTADLSAVLDAASVGLWHVDFATGRVEWSTTNQRLWGLAAGSFDGSVDTYMGLIAPEDRATAMEGLHQATPEAPEVRMEYRLASAAGARWLRSSGCVEFGDDRSPVAARGITVDISEEKRQQAECVQMRRMVALGRLASGVAHDFNNLLTAIIGFSDLVREVLPAEHVAHADVDEIRRAARSAAVLTQRLLTFGRRGQGGARAVDVNAAIGSVQELLRRTIGENIRLSLDFTARPAHVRIDPVQLEQMMLNLLVNARDAMPAGGTITVATRNVAGGDPLAQPAMTGGDYVAVTVSDTGTGMTDAVRDRAFEPFFTTKERGKGTGLGLATVAEILNRAGGSVAVASHVGEGTTFTIYLPQTDEAVLEMRYHEEAPPQPGPPATVLIVEDDESLRTLAVRTLSARGYVTLTAASAEEAVTMIEQKLPHIDVLLADVMLPGANGRDLHARLRGLWPELRTVFMSGYSLDSLQRLQLLDGTVPLLQKPFTPRALARQIAEALQPDTARSTPRG